MQASNAIKETKELGSNLSVVFFFSSRRRHTRWNCDWSSDVCSSDLVIFVFSFCKYGNRGCFCCQELGLNFSFYFILHKRKDKSSKVASAAYTTNHDIGFYP